MEHDGWDRKPAITGAGITADRAYIPYECAWCSDQDNIDRQSTIHLTCPICGEDVHQSGRN